MANHKKYQYCCCCKYQHPYDVNNLIDHCPECGERFAMKPYKEYRLHNLQERYLADREANLSAFQDMMIIVEGILYNIIASKLKSSAIYMLEERRHDLVSESLIMFMEKYTAENSTFKITGSFIGYLQNHVLNPMYHPKKKEREQRETSLSTPVGDDIFLYDMIEVVEGMEGSEEWILNQFQQGLQIEAISELLDTIFISCVRNFDLKTALIIVKALQMQIDPEVDQEQITEYWEYYTNKIQVIAEYSLSSLYEFIRTEIVMTNQVITYEEFIEAFGKEEETEEDEESTIVETDELGEYI